MEKKIIFRPELLLEFHLDATQKKSKLTIQDANDAILVLEGIKKLTTNHLALIYLDENDVVVGVETFVRAIDAFDVVQATRAISSVLTKHNRDSMVKVVVAQTVPSINNPSIENINIKELANFAARILLFGIELVDCILMGEEGYFSFKGNATAWQRYSKELAYRKELLFDKPFLPDVLQKNDSEKSD